MNNIKEYFESCWKFRHLALNLVGTDLRARFRRSHLGIFWAILQPLALASLFGYVLAVMFKQPFAEQCVYVFSGVVAWDLFAQSLSAGSGALLNAEGFLRQSKIPILIFHIRQVLINLVIAFLGFIGFAIFCLIANQNVFSFLWVMIIPWFIIATLFTTPLIVISSIINTLFRDYQQAIGVALQGLWYVTPAFIPLTVFEHGALATWNMFNPVAKLLALLRDPIIYHKMWNFVDLVSILFWIIGLNVIAVFLIAKYEKKLIYSF